MTNGYKKRLKRLAKELEPPECIIEVPLRQLTEKEKRLNGLKVPDYTVRLYNYVTQESARTNRPNSEAITLSSFHFSVI